MYSKQYEELCRYFLAEKLNISIDNIKSIYIENPNRPGLPKYKHQIDLYWESDNELNLYLNIANAKWRSLEKVKQGEVLLLQQIKQKVSAHKAMMITNTGFTSGAIAVAKDEGISLHIVEPNFDYTNLSINNSDEIQNEIQRTASSRIESIYKFTPIHKAFEFNEIRPQPIKLQGNFTEIVTKPVSDYTNKVVRNTSTKSGNIGSINRESGSSVRFSKGNSGGFTKG